MPKQILVVEDDAGARESLKLLLELEGFAVHAAQNGLEALGIIERIGPPCLILLDLMMPVMSGWEFLEALEAKERDTLEHAHIVIVSAVADLTARPLNRPWQVLAKPFAIEPIIELAGACCSSQ